MSDEERRQLHDLAAQLREATVAAIVRRPSLARTLDEARCDIERLLMSAAWGASELRRAIMRAQMTLDAWRSVAALKSQSG